MKKSNSKVLNFFKTNAVYLIFALCIMAIGLSITLVLLKGDYSEQTNIPGDQVASDLPKEDVSVDVIIPEPTNPV